MTGCTKLSGMKFRSRAASRWALGSSFLMGCVALSACDSGETSTTPPASAGATNSNTAGASNHAGAANTAGAGPSAGASSVGGAGNGTAGAATTAGAGGAPASGGSNAGGAGSSTAGAGGAVASGGCAGALICEDFESYTDKPAGPWKVDNNSGTTVAIDTTKHVSGSKSVKFTTDGVNTYQRAYIGLMTPTFPITGNAFYGRMMLYLTKAPTDDSVHWTNIQAEGPVSAQGVTSAKVRYGGQQMQNLMANYDSDGKASDCWQHSATKIPEGRWACMQWYFDGKSNTQKFWLDSQPIDDLTVMGTGQGCKNHDLNDTWYFPQDFTTAYVGWESYQKDDPREVWIDDFALGTAPIACPAVTP